MHSHRGVDVRVNCGVISNAGAVRVLQFRLEFGAKKLTIPNPHSQPLTDQHLSAPVTAGRGVSEPHTPEQIGLYGALSSACLLVCGARRH